MFNHMQEFTCNILGNIYSNCQYDIFYLAARIIRVLIQINKFLIYIFEMNSTLFYSRIPRQFREILVVLDVNYFDNQIKLEITAFLGIPCSAYHLKFWLSI